MPITTTSELERRLHPAGTDLERRRLLKLAGAAALTATSIVTIPFAKAQDMSNGADNFYTSDRVALRKVTFRNQFQMNVAGNLFNKDHSRRARAYGNAGGQRGSAGFRRSPTDRADVEGLPWD